MSLRLRLILALVLVNAAVLGTLAWWTAEREQAREYLELERQEDLRRRLTQLVVPRFNSAELGDLAQMLDWPLWSQFDDALIIDTEVLELSGSSVPVGTFLNPLGRRQRARDFPLELVTDAVVRATQENRTIAVAGGLALPLTAYEPFAKEQHPWGGMYVALPLRQGADGMWTRILLAALASTLVGGIAIMALINSLVLRPVERLVRVTESFGPGNKPLPLPVEGAREVVTLSRSFEQMMQRIHGFQGELELEVEAATKRVLEGDRLAAHRERMAAMGALAAGVAHEINSPLAGALYVLEVLRRDASTEQGRKYGSLMQEALERIRDLVQRLLQLSPGKAESSSADVGRLLDDLRAFLASRLRTHTLVVELPNDDFAVAASRGDLFPLMLNLLQNALDALDGQQEESGGTITVQGTHLENGGTQLVIADNGPGAPAQILPHLFEPFFTSKDVGKGTGLGLAIAHASMRRLGGSIQAANGVEGGFRVVLEFPQEPAEEITLNAGDHAALPPSAEDPRA